MAIRFVKKTGEYVLATKSKKPGIPAGRIRVVLSDRPNGECGNVRVEFMTPEEYRALDSKLVRKEHVHVGA